MTGGLSKNFHGVGIGPLSKILAVKYLSKSISFIYEWFFHCFLGILFLPRKSSRCEMRWWRNYKGNNFRVSTLLQSYVIKSAPWTILGFRILGIFSVENIKRCVLMFQTCSNSQLLRRVVWISAEQTIGASLKHKNTQPLYIFNSI